MIDTHAHLHDCAFDADRGAVVARAKEHGIQDIITVGCDLNDSARAVECARGYALHASLGIHPHEAKDAPDDLETAFDAFLEGSQRIVVAIGETGLDYFYSHSPPAEQKRVLRAQLRVASKRSLPAIFHQRDAFDDFVSILQEDFSPGMRGVVHCFTGNAQQAMQLTGRFGLKLGIGGVLTFKNAQTLRDAVQVVGARHLLLETDCPYLAPVPHRGRRNEPSFAAHTAKVLAATLNCSSQELTRITDSNARELFNL